jgi:ribosomal protein S12
VPTIQQLVRKGRSPKVVKTKASALNRGNPQCAARMWLRVYTTTIELGSPQRSHASSSPTAPR